MSGSVSAYLALRSAYAGFLIAEAHFDANFTPSAAKAADAAWLRTVEAARRADPLSLRSPSIKDWIETRLRTASPFLGSIPTNQGRAA